MATAAPAKTPALSPTGSLILENVSEDHDYDSLVRWASNLLTTPLVCPKDTDTALLLTTLLPVFVADAPGAVSKKLPATPSPPAALLAPHTRSALGLATAHLFEAILDLHGPHLFAAMPSVFVAIRGVWEGVVSDLTVSGGLHEVGAVGAVRNARQEKSFVESFTLAHASLGLGGLALVQFLVRVLRRDLDKNLAGTHPRFSNCLVYKALERSSLTVFLRSDKHSTLKTITEMLFLDTPNALVKAAARDAAFDLLNLLVRFCQEAPSANSDRISFETLETELWYNVKDDTPARRVLLYRGITSPEFRTHMILADLCLHPCWTHGREIQIDPRVEFVSLYKILDSCFHVAPDSVDNVPALLAMMLMLAVDNENNGGGRKGKAGAVAELEGRVGVWGVEAGFGEAWVDRVMAPLRLWAIC
ncbi:hypothetical protein HDU98_001861 [Podochytrium sp. JEL0797]|nr:hypothetical protein HDU98_001861 [Podochytrium sp. JEL0797]